VDRERPLAGLRAAWQRLGQDPSVLADCDHLPDLLARSVAAFVPAAIPAQTGDARELSFASVTMAGLDAENGD
jgi:hypothetical protein